MADPLFSGKVARVARPAAVNGLSLPTVMRLNRRVGSALLHHEDEIVADRVFHFESRTRAIRVELFHVGPA